MAEADWFYARGGRQEGPTDLQTLRDMIAGGITTRLPASFLQVHRHVTVMLDEEAAAALQGRET